MASGNLPCVAYLLPSIQTSTGTGSVGAFLRGTIRDHVTQRRRPLVRFFACGQDLSHEAPDVTLPEEVASGAEPFLVVGAMAGG